MVERRRQVHRLSRQPGAVGEHRAGDDLVDPDDGDLGVVDHRGGDDAAESAEAGDRDRRAVQFVERHRAVTGGRRQAGDLGRQRPDVAALGVVDDRHHQPLGCLRGDAEVDGAVAFDHPVVVLEAGVHLRGTRRRRRSRRASRSGSTVSRGRASSYWRLSSARNSLDVGDVDLLDVGEVGDPPRRLLHPLGDVAAQADDLDRLDVVVNDLRGDSRRPTGRQSSDARRAADRDRRGRPDRRVPCRSPTSSAMPRSAARRRTAGAASRARAVKAARRMPLAD